jgi:hypothetical protein
MRAAFSRAAREWKIKTLERLAIPQIKFSTVRTTLGTTARITSAATALTTGVAMIATGSTSNAHIHIGRFARYVFMTGSRNRVRSRRRKSSACKPRIEAFLGRSVPGKS